MREVRDNDTDTGFIQGSSLLTSSTGATQTRKPLASMAFISINSLYTLIFLILIYLWDIFLHDDTISAAHIERKKNPTERTRLRKQG